MKTTMKNDEIYTLGNLLLNVLKEDNTMYIPAKTNFFIQKNKQNIIALAKEIELARMAIIEHYGKIKKDTGEFEIAPDNIQIANQEILDLLNIEQEVNIYMINIEDLDGLEFTSQQMETLLFMINYEEE